MPNKREIIGSGITGIIGAPRKPQEQISKEPKTPYARRGRPCKGEEIWSGGETRNTSLALDIEQYEQIKERAYNERRSVKEMMYRLLQYALENIDN